ncbi:phage tail protein [Kosakonia cowanii]
MPGENMIYTTGSIAVSGNALTGTGTNFTALLSVTAARCWL